MARIGFVVEGKTLETLLRYSLCPWLQRKGVTATIIDAGGHSRLIKEASQHLRGLRRKRCQRIFFVLDQEKDPCPPATAKRLESVRGEPDAVVCVVAPMLEAWLLADSEAVQKATGQSFGDPTDSLPNPVDTLKTLFSKKYRQSFSKMEMAKIISRYFSLERAARNNHSAARFFRKVNEAVEQILQESGEGG
ncbi:MAG: DUF4276 family protein [Anaerolineae bacterium]